MFKSFFWMIYLGLLLSTPLQAQMQTNCPIKSIVFDFGGVIIKVDRRPIICFLTKTFSITPEELQPVLEQMKAFVLKGGTEQEFWLEYAVFKGITLSIDWYPCYVQTLDSVFQEVPNMVAIVKSLQCQGFQTPLFSNVTLYQSQMIRDRGYYQYFKPLILSYEIGYEKPNQEAFEVLVEALNSPPNSILLIDDQIENIAAARRFGIDGILFENPQQLIKELKRRGIHVCI